jgi:hypothetical protein
MSTIPGTAMTPRAAIRNGPDFPSKNKENGVTCKPEYSFLVRLNKVPPDAYEGVYIYTKPTVGNTASVSKPVNSLTFSGSATLCFSEDPNSSVRGLKIDTDAPNCSACKGTPSWDGTVLTTDASAGTPGSGGGVLVLRAQEVSTGIWHSAMVDPVGIDGGRPIIRNTFGQGIFIAAIALVAFGVIYMFAKWWISSHQSGQPSGP